MLCVGEGRVEAEIQIIVKEKSFAITKERLPQRTQKLQQQTQEAISDRTLGVISIVSPSVLTAATVRAGA
jgi:hypothetical protein